MTGFRRRVPGRRRADISTHANLLRNHFSLIAGDSPDAFPVVEYVEFVLPQVMDDFVLEIVDDHEMPGMEGATWPDKLHMKLPRSVYERAAANDGRARFTVSHELGHLLLHQGVPFFRETHQSQTIAPYECSEWQANEFAASLLMPEEVVKACGSVRDIMERCGVSQTAAVNRLKVLKMVKPRGW